MIKKISILLLLLLSSNYIQSQTKTTSDLWGENGELWNSRGRLPDFSYAGYGGGYAVKPSFDNIINVLDQGVLANDGLSDVVAIDAIIRSAPNNSIIFFPAGRYVIDDWLKIERSNIIIRGEGEGTDGTVFYMPKSATDINGSYQGLYSTGDKGHIIEFFGRFPSTVTTVSEEALIGDKVIVVASVSNLSVGDIIEINATGNNPVNGPLWHEYFNNQSQDYPLPHASWLSADGGSMFHTIEKIEGNLVTLREPLRLNIKPSWNMEVQKRNSALTNVGIENLRVEFIEVPKVDHLDEPGYNAIQFNSCYNFWSNNISIVNSDNGILITRSAHGEVENTTMLGREGHHGFKIAYSANNVLNGIYFNNAVANIHSVTIIHKANGNVVRNISADNSVNDNTISLDFHRNAPFSNLWTDVRSVWTHKSSGNTNAGPHAGARNVYWGLTGESTALFWGNGWTNEWGYYQNTIVSGLKTAEIFTEEREWYEYVPDLAEKDLYEVQKRYHAEFIHETVFNSNTYGNRGDWKERDASRWKVQDIEGEKYYSLFEEELPPVTTGKLSEYTVTEFPSGTIYEIETNIKSIDKLENRSESDIVLVTSFIDDNNYLFARISTDQEKSGIFSVANGALSKLVGTSSTLQNDDEVLLKLGVLNNQIIFTMNNGLVAKADYNSTIPFGKIGVGSSKNGLLFNDFIVNDSLTSTTLDTDNDGVLNSEDLCPDTIAGAVVDELGCASIPSNNFTIVTTGETCIDKGNGQIVINAVESLNYVATIDGTDYNFTSSTTIENLMPGTYDLCIKIEGRPFEQCYTVNIDGGVELSGKIQITKQSASVSVDLGTAPYTVFKNGEAIFETYQSTFSVPVTHGDEIQVSSKASCEGLISKSINLFEDIKAYPNPSAGLFELYIPNSLKTIDLEIYSIHSQLISNKIYPVNGGKVELNIEDNPSGIYFVKVNVEKPVFIKLIKK
ncbi:T9SS type A sorting domain-containing protein [uncultured Algibacter sp.]|uniref:T9SS type A sorting domain-containing protein n=1 Tax=uncultured Algibacter sp. TaxID=298659 RepID=UPI002604B19F|nr:T9SS type A sorting domain-containing protein [uncultured Algibacter sp.]